MPKLLKPIRKVDCAAETLEKSQAQIEEIQEQIAGFNNSITDLTKEIERLT